MKRFFLLLGAVVALLVLATTAAFAADGRGKSDASHGKAKGHVKHQSGGPQAGTSGAPAKVKVKTHGQSGEAHGKSGAKVKGGANASGHVPPGCNGTIHLSAGATAENGTQPKYTMGEEVWAHGRGFDESESFTHFTVYKVNSGHAVIKDEWSGWDADASGAFDLDVINTSLTPGHEYQVVVYWNETLPNGKEKECRKSKNFFTVGEEEQGGGVGGTTTEETGGTTTGEVGGTTTGGVAGTTASGGSQSGGGAGGVLGEAAGETLPFTGLPIWIVVLAGAGLLTAGLMVRRLARGTR
jgi:hypothetical protein